MAKAKQQAAPEPSPMAKWLARLAEVRRQADGLLEQARDLGAPPAPGPGDGALVATAWRSLGLPDREPRAIEVRRAGGPAGQGAASASHLLADLGESLAGRLAEHAARQAAAGSRDYVAVDRSRIFRVRHDNTTYVVLRPGDLAGPARQAIEPARWGEDAAPVVVLHQGREDDSDLPGWVATAAVAELTRRMGQTWQQEREEAERRRAAAAKQAARPSESERLRQVEVELARLKGEPVPERPRAQVEGDVRLGLREEHAIGMRRWAESIAREEAAAEEAARE